MNKGGHTRPHKNEDKTTTKMSLIIVSKIDWCKSASRVYHHKHFKNGIVQDRAQ